MSGETQIAAISSSNSGSKIGALVHSPWAMVVVALAIRTVVLGFVYTSQLDPAQDHWNFGCEMGRVARSIATGQGFSSPYTIPTGPTALLPPVYPLLLAAIFKGLGIYTTGSALAILTLNNLFSSFTCLPVFLIARRIFGLRAAAWSGWIWAIFPYSIMLSNLWIWETVVTTFFMTLIVLATLHIEHSKSVLAWVLYGLLWGIAALTSPAVLATLPFLGAWAWLGIGARQQLYPCGGALSNCLFCLRDALDLALFDDLRTVCRIPRQPGIGNPCREQQ